MVENNKIIVGFACIISAFQVIHGDIVKGSVSLNSGVFDKIINRHKVVLVKFDETYPYGDKQDAFKKVASSTISQPDLIIGEVQIADYGDKDNSDLGERFSVKKEELPVYKLFMDGKEKATYSGDVKNADDIKSFLIQQSGLWIGLPACLENFDNLVKDFFKAGKKTAQEKVIAKAEEAIKELTSDSERTSAEIYIKTMKKILEKGKDFVETEIARVEKLKAGKVSDKKKEQLGDRLSILTSFKIRQKDEL
ncbi:endoplasmic reticulum resident protein 29-like [Liolophura sinensis]|uniref:endoplasmic reticulum resident protein 29-like n=1 Tax=Liolophura sinensis TaxID=3198878 RepID=UPI003158EE74